MEYSTGGPKQSTDATSLANDSFPAASHWSSGGGSTDVTLTAPGRVPAIVRHPNSSVPVQKMKKDNVFWSFTAHLTYVSVQKVVCGL